jgi:hypothetical protein
MFEALLPKRLKGGVPATKLRMRITERNNAVAIYLAEWTFIDSDGKTLTEADYNLASIAASSQYAPDWGPRYAFDGRIEDGGSTPKVRWQTNQSGEQWIEIGFNRPIIIQKYRIHVGVTAAMSNNTQYSLKKWVLETPNGEGGYDAIHTIENQTIALWSQGPYREFVL